MDGCPYHVVVRWIPFQKPLKRIVIEDLGGGEEMAGLAQTGSRADPVGFTAEGAVRSVRETAPQVPAAGPSSVDTGTGRSPLLGGVEEEASVCSDGAQEVSVPDPPNSSIQFQADWKRLGGNRTALSVYFKVYI